MARGRHRRPRHGDALGVMSCAAHPAQGPLHQRRWIRRGASCGSIGISGFSCSSPCPARSPASPLLGNIDSLPGQVALRQLQFKGGVQCASSSAGERMANPLPASPDLTRSPRAPPAPLAGRRDVRRSPCCRCSRCDSSATPWRPPHDDLRHVERLQSGGVTWPSRAVEAAVRRWHVGSVVWPLRASSVGPRL